MRSEVADVRAAGELTSEDIDRASRRVMERFAREGKRVIIERDGEILEVPAAELITWEPMKS